VSKRFAGFVQHGFERERNDGEFGKNAGVIAAGRAASRKLGFQSAAVGFQSAAVDSWTPGADSSPTLRVD